MKRLIMSIVAACAAFGQLALGHTELSGSVPADKAVLEAAPEELVLHFSEPVRLTALALQAQGESKRSLGPLPAEPSDHFAVDAPTLRDGQYTVSWRALSEDTHVMTGEFVFAVGAGTAHDLDSAETEHSSAHASEHSPAHSSEHSGAH